MNRILGGLIATGLIAVSGFAVANPSPQPQSGNSDSDDLPQLMKAMPAGTLGSGTRGLHKHASATPAADSAAAPPDTAKKLHHAKHKPAPESDSKAPPATDPNKSP